MLSNRGRQCCQINILTLLEQYREKKRQKNTFDLNASVHESEYNFIQKPIDPKIKVPIEPAHRFEVNIEPDSFTQEKSEDPDEVPLDLADPSNRFELFRDYQKTVHKEDYTTESSFKRFLCSGLGQKSLIENGKEKLIGSYHQCYRLDGKLIALGVLDLLPKCVSSVYLMYVTGLVNT